MKLNTPNFYNYVIDNVTTGMHVFYEFLRSHKPFFVSRGVINS